MLERLRRCRWRYSIMLVMLLLKMTLFQHCSCFSDVYTIRIAARSVSCLHVAYFDSFVFCTGNPCLSHYVWGFCYGHSKNFHLKILLLQIYKSKDKREDCDLWKDGFFSSKVTRYLCITRKYPLENVSTSSVIANTLFVSVHFIRHLMRKQFSRSLFLP